MVFIEIKKLVRNLFYQPDDSVLAKLSSTPDRHGNKSKYNLVKKTTSEQRKIKKKRNAKHS